jgi:hypothetical protein
MPHDAQKPRKIKIDGPPGACYTVGNTAGQPQYNDSPEPGWKAGERTPRHPESESKRTLHFDSAQLHWLWNETRLRLKLLATRADEGVDVQAAMDFAHWIQFSGLIKLFKDNPQSEPLKVDGELIGKLVRDLVMDCGDFLKLNTPGFVRVCQIEAVNHKLDLIAAQLGKLSPPATETATAGASPPALQVIQGGVE